MKGKKKSKKGGQILPAITEGNRMQNHDSKSEALMREAVKGLIGNRVLQKGSGKMERIGGRQPDIFDIIYSDLIKSKGKTEGAKKANKGKTEKSDSRRRLINEHLQNNPTPKLKGHSLEGYLINTLQLKKANGKCISERTVKNDLKIINSVKR
jgi:hypothetical protein